MRTPRGLSGTDLAQALEALGYTVTRQTGSHLRLSTDQHGRHHVTIPRHDSLKIGTTAAILAEVARHAGLEKDALIGLLFPR